ncbi:MAG: ABC transporter ATP-binding protein/permease, partial [Candidatus Tectomicrobia bacterium]|nr:ABC transporter ATP-binding protein/permease [Candidatus Tectomicrobia bacterium]
MKIIARYVVPVRSFVDNIWAVVRLAWHEDWRLVTSRGILKAFSAGIPAAQAYLAKLLFDTLSAGYGSGDSRVWRTAIGYLLLEVLLLAARTALQSAGRLVDAQLNHLLRYGLTRRLMAHAAVLDIASYEDQQLQERIQRISDETPWRVQEVLGAIFNAAGEIVALLAVLFIIVRLGGWYVGLLFGATVPAILLGVREGQMVYAWSKAWSKWYRYADYFRHVVLLPQFVMEMRLFRLGSYFVERFWHSAQTFMRAYFWLEVRRQRLSAIKTLLPDLGYACGLGLLARDVVRGAVTVGDAVMFIGAFKAAQGSLGTIAEAIGQLYESYLFITDLQVFLHMSPRLVAPAGARVLQPGEPLTVAFQQVWFRYAEDQPYVLRDVSFTLAPGERVALIGENGAGKTTLIKLLLRFYDPSMGHILINGTDLREIDLASYYANIGMIFQEPMRHEARVREQIGYGDLAAVDDMARIREAAKLGGADAFIDKLPGAFEAHLGLWELEEHTQKLSGGQWQRLALARAMM